MSQRSKAVGGTQQRMESRRERAGPNQEQGEKGGAKVGIPADVTGANHMDIKMSVLANVSHVMGKE